MVASPCSTEYFTRAHSAPSSVRCDSLNLRLRQNWKYLITARRRKWQWSDGRTCSFILHSASFSATDVPGRVAL